MKRVLSLALFLLIITSVLVAQSVNPLMQKKLQEEDVRSGNGTLLGKRAFIVVTVVEFRATDFDHVAEFYKSFKDKNYRWVTVMRPDGKGLIFTGGGTMATFCNIDKFGRQDGPSEWTIIYDEKLDIFRELKP
jgi:hypothetical protein